MTSNSIKFKYSFFLALLLLLTVAVLSLFVLDGIRGHQRDTAEANLRGQARAANLSIKQAYFEANAPEPQPFIRSRGAQLAMDLAVTSGLRVALFDLGGRKTGDSAPQSAAGDAASSVGYALKGSIAYQREGSFLLYAAPMQGPDAQMGVILLQYPLDEDIRFYRGTARWFVIAGSAVAAISFLLGYLYFGRSASDVIALSRTAERIRDGRFPASPPLPRRRDELGKLSDSIYYMSEEIAANMNALQSEAAKLRLAVAKLQELERSQKAFIGNISHEFKTPLTSIKANVELMSMYPGDADLRADAVRHIERETARLQDMVETVLRLAALEKYDFEYETENVDIRELLRDLTERAKAKAARYGVELRADLSEACVWAERESLVHVFVNLLDNALKYNVPGGYVRVSCREEGETVTIDVANSGYGIPDGEKERIFEPFQTADPARSRKSGGAGLGLPLVKRLTEKQQGTVELLADGEEIVFRVKLKNSSIKSSQGGSAHV